MGAPGATRINVRERLRVAPPARVSTTMKGSVSILHLVLDAEADPDTKLARATDFWLNLSDAEAYVSLRRTTVVFGP